jgi:hypothetical protein
VATDDEAVLEFNHSPEDYICWLEGLGPGCDFVVDQLRQGSTLALGEVIQQILFANPPLGEHLHMELEEADKEGRLFDDCDVPNEIVEAYYREPTVFIRFMDTMERVGVDYSHGVILRAVDLADYKQEIEEIAMSMKTLEEDVKELRNDTKKILEQLSRSNERTAAIEEAQKHLATKTEIEATKTEIANTRTAISNVKVWVLGLGFSSLFTIFVGVIIVVVRWALSGS